MGKRSNKPLRCGPAISLRAAFAPKVGQAEANSIALTIFAHMDAAKRGECTHAGTNHLYKHLMVASFLAAASRWEAFHAEVTDAFAALKKASERPTDLLDLTTGEYKSIREAFATYVELLPKVDIHLMAKACAAAEHRMVES